MHSPKEALIFKFEKRTDERGQSKVSDRCWAAQIQLLTVAIALGALVSQPQPAESADNTQTQTGRVSSVSSGYSADLPARQKADASGRQLAIAVPHAPVSTITPLKTVTGQLKPTKTATPLNLGDWSKGACKSALSTINQIETSARPYAQSAMASLLEICKWTGALLKQLDELPVVTPAGPPYAMTKPHVLAASKLVYTEEGRLKTVVTR